MEVNKERLCQRCISDSNFAVVGLFPLALGIDLHKEKKHACKLIHLCGCRVHTLHQPSRCPSPNLRNLWICYLSLQKDLADVMSPKNLRWGEPFKLPRWAQSNHMTSWKRRTCPVVVRGCSDYSRKGQQGAMSLALKVERGGFEPRNVGALSLGMWVASEVGKGKEMGSPELPVGTQPHGHQKCSSMRLESNVCPIKL